MAHIDIFYSFNVREGETRPDNPICCALAIVPLSNPFCIICPRAEEEELRTEEEIEKFPSFPIQQWIP